MSTNQDAEHIRLLSIFHYVHAGLVAFYSLFALIYVAMGVLFAASPLFVAEQTHDKPQPARSEKQRQVETGDSAGNATPAKDRSPANTSQAPLPDDVADSPRTDPSIYDDHPPTRSRDMPPQFAALLGVGFAVFGLLFLLIGLTFATGSLLAGRFLARRKHRTFCTVVAGLNCMNAPVGTVLGVFTLIVLLRPSVKLLFDEATVPEGKPITEDGGKQSIRERS